MAQLNRPTIKAKAPAKVKPAKSPVFGPLAPATAPLVRAEKQAQTKTQKARAQVVKNVVVPAVPKLRAPTSGQRGAAQALVAKGLRQQGVTSVADVQALPAAQRQRVSRAKAYGQTARKDVAAIRALQAGATAPTVQGLASTGRKLEAQTRAQAKPGHPHGVTALGVNVDPLAVGRSVGKIIATSPAGAFVKGIGKLATPMAQDAAELAVTTPSSIAKLATTAVSHPEKLPGMLAAPYEELAKHPGKFISSHPVTTLLMVDPALHVPGRAVGRVARLAGKQTLERPAAVLPGTALKEARTGSRNVVVRALQSRADEKAGTPSMTPKQVRRRVDEYVAREQLERGRVQRVVGRAEKHKAKATLPKAERKPYIAERVEGASGQLRGKAQERFAREFGATAYHNDQGALIKPKNATEGVLHDSQADAKAVADKLNAKVPKSFVVRQAGDKFAVIPKVAADRLTKVPGSEGMAHSSVGTSPATMAKLMRRARAQFSQTVLPLSPKWLAGQAVEAGAVRAPIAGAGPASFLRARRVLKALPEDKRTELYQRAAGGGQFGLTGPARDFVRGTTLADEFEKTALHGAGKAATVVGKPFTHVRKGWRHYSDFVFNTVNGAVEQAAQTAMLGKAIKRSPLMERSLFGMSDKAIQEAARGLHATENQVALGRAVDRMYGKYSKFSPEMRSLIMHWTPFIPWYLNVVTFLGKVLPVDHPVTAALIASADKATEEWRKAHGLSLRGGKTRPSFLLGSYPTGKGDQVIRLGHFTPFGAGPDLVKKGVIATATGLALPQFGPLVASQFGVDWTGKPLKYPGYKGRPFNGAESDLYALEKQAEAMVPGLAAAGRVTGLAPKLIEHKPVKPLKARLKAELPFTPTASPPTKKKGGRAPSSGWGGSGSGSKAANSGWGGSGSAKNAASSGWGQ